MHRRRDRGRVVSLPARRSRGGRVLPAGSRALLQRLPSRPVRGQMVALSNGAARLRACCAPTADTSCRATTPRRSAWWPGALSKTPASISVSLRAAWSRFSPPCRKWRPALAAAEVVETWSGLRPDTPDHLPLLGPGELDGLTFATGHYRNGILLAPITAKLVREWVTERRVSLDWERFSPLRFSGADRGDPPARFSAKTQG